MEGRTAFFVTSLIWPAHFTEVADSRDSIDFCLNDLKLNVHDVIEFNLLDTFERYICGIARPIGPVLESQQRDTFFFLEIEP